MKNFGFALGIVGMLLTVFGMYVKDQDAVNTGLIMGITALGLIKEDRNF